MRKFFLFCAVALLSFLCACISTQDGDPDAITHPVYFLAPAGTSYGDDAIRCSQEPFHLSEDTSCEELARAVVERLLRGSQDGALLSPFPKDTTLISLSIRNHRAYVDLSGISLLEGIDLTLADYCLTLSLTAIDGIESISITGNGKLLLQQPRRVFFPYDVLLSSEDSGLQQVQVLLYFPDADGALTAEKRTLDVYEGETQIAVLLAALLSGPRNDDLLEVIPEDLTISSIKAENGVCLIHLSETALSALPEDEYTQKLILWSLAESIYSLDDIQEIRLLVNGEELELFGNVPVSSIAERAQG